MQLADVAAGVLVRMLELAAGLEVLAVIVGKGQLVQRAADHRLRLVALGDDDAAKPWSPAATQQ